MMADLCVSLKGPRLDVKLSCQASLTTIPRSPFPARFALLVSSLLSTAFLTPPHLQHTHFETHFLEQALLERLSRITELSVSFSKANASPGLCHLLSSNITLFQSALSFQRQ